MFFSLKTDVNSHYFIYFPTAGIVFRKPVANLFQQVLICLSVSEAIKEINKEKKVRSACSVQIAICQKRSIVSLTVVTARDNTRI